MVVKFAVGAELAYASQAAAQLSFGVIRKRGNLLQETTDTVLQTAHRVIHRRQLLLQEISQRRNIHAVDVLL